jgi:hypothetical protein
MDAAMGTIRAFFRDHRRLTALAIALALAMKALVPGGYMLGVEGKVLTVHICADASGTSLTKQIVLPASGKTGDQAKAAGSCPYASLGMAGLAGADLALLALALAFVLALGFAAVPAPPAARPAFLRPPLRGPPTPA